MPKLYLFNPENDLALADGGKSYTPPPLARAIAHDLSTLPVWYAGDGDAVCLPSLQFARPLEPFLDKLGIGRRFCVPHALPSDISACLPWGWSPEAAQRLLRYGAPAHALPTGEMLARQRWWAHRIRTRELLTHLRDRSVDVPDELPTLFSREEEVARFVTRHERAMLKAPWSGSGKGLCFTRGDYDLVTRRWVQGVLRRQGEVVGEPFFDRAVDMAMEFYSDGNAVTFAGYSWFVTDARGAYKGNYLLPDAEIERRLSAYLPLGDVRRLREQLEIFFTRHVATVYRGYFGVDMMIYRRVGAWALHPCVEINLRMSMGMVSRLFHDRYVAEGSEGVYRVEYFTDPERLLSDHCHRQAVAPLQYAGTRIESGYLSLNPIYPDTRYRASVEIHRASAGETGL